MLGIQTLQEFHFISLMLQPSRLPSQTRTLNFKMVNLNRERMGELTEKNNRLLFEDTS